MNKIIPDNQRILNISKNTNPGRPDVVLSERVVWYIKLGWR